MSTETKRLYYSDNEMAAMFRGCLDPLNQIKILADLNWTDDEIAIYNALIRGGISPSKLPDKKSLSASKKKSANERKSRKKEIEWV